MKVMYYVVIGTRDKSDNVRYDTFEIILNKEEDDADHKWYDDWEGGGDTLELPNCKSGKIKHIDTEGGADMKCAEECWTKYGPSKTMMEW